MSKMLSSETKTLQALRKTLTKSVDELVDFWADPYKAPEQKRLMGQRFLNEAAEELSTSSLYLGIPPVLEKES